MRKMYLEDVSTALSEHSKLEVSGKRRCCVRIRGVVVRISVRGTMEVLIRSRWNGSGAHYLTSHAIVQH